MPEPSLQQLSYVLFFLKKCNTFLKVQFRLIKILFLVKVRLGAMLGRSLYMYYVYITTYLVSIAFAHFPVKVSLGLHIVGCEKNDTLIILWAELCQLPHIILISECDPIYLYSKRD